MADANADNYEFTSSLSNFAKTCVIAYDDRMGLVMHLTAETALGDMEVACTNFGIVWIKLTEHWIERARIKMSQKIYVIVMLMIYVMWLWFRYQSHVELFEWENAWDDNSPPEGLINVGGMNGKTVSMVSAAILCIEVVGADWDLNRIIGSLITNLLMVSSPVWSLNLIDKWLTRCRALG
jgi:Ca2+/H+ antiporter